MSLFKKVASVILFYLVIFGGVSNCLAKEPVTSLQQLNSPEYTVGTNGSGPTHDVAVKYFPNAKFAYFPEEQSGYIALQHKKIDAFVSNASIAQASIKGGLKNVRILPEFLGEPIKVAAGVSRRSKINGLKEKFNTFIALSKADGTIDDMLKRWVIDGDTKIPDDIKVPEKSDIHLTVGTTGLVVPFSFYIGNKITGFDIEFAKRFAAYLGAELEFIVFNFESAFMVANSGKADLALSNMYYTPERDENANFSDIMYTVDTAVLVYDDNTAQNSNKKRAEADKKSITSIQQLNSPEYTVALSTAGAAYEAVKRDLPRVKTVHIEGQAGYDVVKMGKVDALAYDRTQMEIAIENGLTGVTILPGSIGEKIEVAAGISRASKIPDLKAKINKFISELKSSGTLQDMYKRWVIDGNHTMPDIKVPSSSKLKLTVGTTGLLMPYNYYEGNQLTGFDIELCRRFAERLGAELEFRTYDFGGLIAAAITGEIDCIMADLNITPERAEKIDFSDVLFTEEIALLVKGDNKKADNKEAKTVKSYLTIKDFNGRKIGLKTGTIYPKLVKEVLPNAELYYFDNDTNLITALSTGKVDAIVDDDAIVRSLEHDNPNFTHIDGYLKAFQNALIFSKNPEADVLRNEVNDFISTLRHEGALEKIGDIWFGYDESLQVLPEYEKYPATKGVIKIALDSENNPASYIKDGKIVGYDVDIIVRFCKARGYKPEIYDMNFNAIIPSVIYGKCDIGIGSITITPERMDSVNFSEPVYYGGAMILTNKETLNQGVIVTPAKYTKVTDFDGKRIGVTTGTIYDELVKELLPSAKLFYFDGTANVINALTSGKIDATVADDAIARNCERENPSLRHIDEYLRTFDNAFIFAKTRETDSLRNEVNDFISTLRAEGTLKKLNNKWFGDDESLKFLPEYEKYPATNGIIRIGAYNEYPPFAYIKGGRLVGYDVDIITRFCESKGYKPEFYQMNFDALIPFVISGKGEIGIGAVTITPERAENVNFSVPVYNGGAMILTNRENIKQRASVPRAKYSKISDLEGKRIAVLTGSTHPDITLKFVPTAELVYFDSIIDTFTALKTGKVDAVCTGIPMARLIMAEDDSIAFFGEQLTHTECGAIFAKTEKGKKLCEQFSEFLKAQWDNGTIQEIDSIWFGSDESKKVIKDYSKLPATNGILKMAVDVTIPICTYVKDNKIVGYDVDCAVKFCEAYGYGLEIVPMNFSGVIPAVQTGKCDFGMGGITRTDEREESVLFSYPNMRTGNTFVVRRANVEANRYTSIQELSGKRIGVQSGTKSPEVTKQLVPTAKLVYYDTPADNLIALRLGKIDAACMPESTAKLMIYDNDDVAIMGGRLTSTKLASIFPKTEKGKKLSEEYGEFVKSLWDNGTISELKSKWLGKDETKKTLKDYSKLPAKNGTLKMAVDSAMPPVIYIKDNRIIGYDIDLAVRFCEAKGYALEVVPMSFPGIIPSVQSGKCDFSCGMVCTPEREEAVLFSSTPNTEIGSVIVVKKSDVQASDLGQYTSLEELADKKIGVQTGTSSSLLVEEKLPNAHIEYFDALSDVLIALKTGKIDALCCTIFSATHMMNENDEVTCLDEWLKVTEIAPIFNKSDKGRKLCEEYGNFTKSLWNDGSLKEIESKWLGADESKKVLKDYSKLPATNGTLKMAVDTTMPPLAYVRDNIVVGYDIDLAVRFCEEKGYGLEVTQMNVAGIVAAVQSGKYDFSYSMNVTDERAKVVLFSPTPTAKSGNVMVVLKSKLQQNNTNSGGYTKIKDLSGKKIGIILGANHDIFVAEKIPDAQIEYFNDLSAVTLALQTGKIAAFTNTLPTAIYMTHEHKDMSYVSEPVENTYNYAAFTNSDKGHKICDEYAEFIKSLWDNGTIKSLSDKWIYSENETLRTMEDYSKLPATNGVLKMAIDTGRMPFAYVKDNKITGYDIEIVSMFCKSKGYGLEVYPMDFAGILGSIKTGKCDLTGSITRTEERAETMLFSPVPNAETPIVLIVMKPAETEKSTETEKSEETQINIFIDDLKASFERTFIREDRWKLFIEGIISTMIITVMSIIFGTILGFIVYLLCRGGNVIANFLTRFFVWLLEGMPMVVLLMILYYIIFGKVDIAGIWVAVIAFSLTFGAGVYGMILSGVNALDKGQLEAAYALGFTDRRAFFTIILPQAALHFMPAYKAGVVALIKATAIVGYIAVQDLTKMGDIVRSRTYEAFFPLIAVAVIYFILAGGLNLIVNVIHNRIKPEKRTKNDILRGIDIHD